MILLKMFSSSKNVIAQLNKFLPDAGNLMSLDEYNKLYKGMIDRKKEVESKEEVEKLEERHREIISNAIQGKLKSMKNERKRGNHTSDRK
jgi:hypothetical protein